MNIEINIGIVGSGNDFQSLREIIKDFPNFKPIYLDIDTIDNPIIALNNLQQDVETILFTNYYVCNYYRSRVFFDKPTRYVPITISDGFYDKLNSLISNEEIVSLSVDSITEDELNDFLKKYDNNSKKIICLPGSINNLDEIFEFHKSYYVTNKATILTSIHSVYTRLLESSIPCEFIPLKRSDIINALERALLSTRTRLEKERQVIIGVVHIRNEEEMVAKYVSEKKYQLLKLQVHKIFLNYVESIDGYSVFSGNNEFIFVSTRGIFENESRGYKFMPLLDETKSKTGFNLNIGIGFGYSAIEAGRHARIALAQSYESGPDSCYIVREDQSVFGPIASTRNQKYDKYQISITNKEFLEKAENAGMSAAYMQKLMSRVARNNQIKYTAEELADVLDVTLRSANRILLKWTDAKLVSIIGEEKSTTRGRPKRVYNLDFIKDYNLT